MLLYDEKELSEMTEFRRYKKNNINYSYTNNMIISDNISVGTMLQTPEEVKLSLPRLWFR